MILTRCGYLAKSFNVCIMGFRRTRSLHILSPDKIILRGSLILLASFGIKIILGFARNIYIGRALGAEVLGVFTLGFTIFQIVSILARFGFPDVINRFVPEFLGKDSPEKLNAVLSTSFKTATLFALVGAVFLFASAGFWEMFFNMPGLGLVLQILALVLPLQVVNNLAIATVTAQERVELEAGINNVVFPLLFVVFVWVLVQKGVSLGAIAGGIGLAFVFSFLLVVILAKKLSGFPLSFTQILKKPVDRKFLSFALPLAPWWLLMFAIHSFDTLFLGFFLSAREVGIYSIVLLLVGLPEYLIQAVNTISFPVLSRLVSGKNWLDAAELYTDVRRTLSLIGLPILVLVTLFSRPLLDIFGREFSAKPAVIAILAVGVFLNLSAGPVEHFLTVLDRQRKNLENILLAVLVGIIIGVLTIPAWGLLGAAVTRTVLLGLQNYLGVMQVIKELRDR